MNYRIFVEKKEDFRVEAQNLFSDLKENIGLSGLSDVRVLNIYDIFNLSENDLQKLEKTVFSEVNVDNVYKSLEESLAAYKNENLKKVYFSVEFLPGQYDQRADSAIQCANLLIDEDNDINVKSGKLIILYGDISSEELNKIKKYYINDVEAREKNLNILSENVESANRDKVIVYDGFVEKTEDEIVKMRNDLELAMTSKDLLFIQEYFKNEEKRNPTETEIRVLDTYWSDHCRHTTFETIIDDIKVENEVYKNLFEKAINEYVESRKYVYEEREAKRPMTLMDLATVFGKEQRKNGSLPDLEVSDEINACSIYIDVPVERTDESGKIKVTKEKWILQFKNETHNHPTEIEPFGGAATCIGGAIRDPLSGRTYVYQAVRISGASDPTEKIEDTIKGKLPQKVITKTAAHGFSSYGNQIGLATTHVNEIYDKGYKAKRMELGLVVGAAPAENIIREKPEAGDIVVLLGGRTGRDGIGGATGSSKEHTTESSEKSSAEVQKGNAVTERKIQRLFRNKNVTTLIKKCNDFGAGGVSVAIGELADGLVIDLNEIRVKYIGLTGTELAISESQERMAVVIKKEDLDKFVKYATKENLEAYKVAEINDSNRLVMTYNGETIVDISRDFLNTNGASSNINIEIENSDKLVLDRKIAGDTFKEKFVNNLKDLNVASQRGLVETFDSTIGASTVLMPFGGKYQLTPSEVSVQKVSVMNAETDVASMVGYGYNPYIAKQIPFHGGAYAVIESLAKVVAAGGNYKNVRFTFQEYFERLGNNPKKWGKPLSALLGALHVQKEFKLPSIGGKDSMSGTFNDISVPPTLVSFALSVVSAKNVISSEFKKAENYIYLITTKFTENDLPDFKELKENFDFIEENIKNKNIVSAMAVKNGGIAESIAKMTFGNKLGVNVNFAENAENEWFKVNYGAFIVETSEKIDYKNATLLGKVTKQAKIVINNDTVMDLDELIAEWEKPLEKVFPTKKEVEKSHKIAHYKNLIYEKSKLIEHENVISNITNTYAKPRIFIPVFPGTNSEYDLERAFNKEGGLAKIGVFNNLTRSNILNSIDTFVKEINNSQILMLPGGFSAGDEPDGSAKFMVAVLKNKKVREAVENLLKRDGLILGICNGFQALIKSGLLPYGEIRELNETSPTLTYNAIDKHMSKIVQTKIITNNSPWLSEMKEGDIHSVAISHGEGRVVITEEEYRKLFENNQIATKYVDLEGNSTMDSQFNPNGSYYAIEGMLAYNGRIFGKMGHSERKGKNVYKNIYGNKEQNIFRNGVRFFK
ncbi:phosphoribosylformylglycinamidine synthase [Leptotrichia sp. oral taxon 847]|uniref:phosphoribosylformylglycinamidine synthase n=1 Tax=Leptotrichia sp. oral taxon 847 TaxID=1785996 RepID=UPI000768390E|nr:phosphoribosylformylglycinamidine synthase [Leptotrichia sp. oral taxon 847]AMD94421.1 phosphoribosylformylglycinamidine synthase [Leptotrichia sp. oral taxon 847]